MKQVLAIATIMMMMAVPSHALEPTKEILLNEPISDEPGKYGVTALITWPAGAEVGNHTHPGDEFAMVLEGAIEVTTHGVGSHIYKKGEAYHNAKGVVHCARAVGDKPAKTLATLVVEKGKPLSEPVSVEK